MDLSLRMIGIVNQLDETTNENVRLREEIRRLREALAFAQSVIKSGEPWTTTCEDVIGGALGHEGGATQAGQPGGGQR